MKESHKNPGYKLHIPIAVICLASREKGKLIHSS